MSGFKEFDRYDALGLSELVRTKQVTASELCEEAISRIEKINPLLNAVVTPMYEQGRVAAAGKLPDGPFRGVPFLLKDLTSAYAGVPLTCGCKARKFCVPDRDSEMVSRYKNTGVVILGKTNTPEFGLLGITESELLGPCRNPWGTDHTPGGSSGGTAAAVAGGIMPMAAGGDGGGSIRIPSAYCGLFGLKPSRGRNPSGPDQGREWQDAVQEHVLTRSVRDSAAMLDAVHGPALGAPYEIRPPEKPYLEEIHRDPGQLIIALNTESPLGTPVHPDCVMAAEDAAKLLEDLGHRVERDQPDVDGKMLAQSYLTMNFAEVAANIRELKGVLRRKPKSSDMESLTWTLGLLGEYFSSGHLVEALRFWDLAGYRIGVFFQKYDLYLTPTTAYPPARIGELAPKATERALIKVVNVLRLGWLLNATGVVDSLAEKNLARTPFTQVANLCGLPAMSVPLYWTAEGFPSGVQFIAPFGEEGRLFRLAAQLEKARPWYEKRPPVWAG